jgi:serine/threonine-protein kinase Chk2
MLTVDVEKRYTIDDCLEHPWTTQKTLNVNDSTDGLVGGLANLDFSKRKMARERTLLSSINDVKITHVIEIESDKDPVKIYIKNPNGKSNQNKVNKSVDTNSNGIPKSRPGAPKQEETPSQNRDPTEFMGLGGKGDQELFGNEGSIYSKNELTETTKG